MLQEEKVERKRMFDMLQAITKKTVACVAKVLVMANKKPEKKDFFQQGCF